MNCACGCLAHIDPFDRKGRPHQFLPGHQSRVHNPGLKAMQALPKPEPGQWRADGKHWRTARWRARQTTNHERCWWEAIGGCKGPIQVAHVDQDYTNNDEANRLALCVSHHRLLDNGRIDPENPVMPTFYIDGSGKRRYGKSPYWDRPRRPAPAAPDAGRAADGSGSDE